METSAKTRTNVDEVYQTLMRKVRERKEALGKGAAGGNGKVSEKNGGGCACVLM